ncbi:uncharacterized protein [Miscanthus floridulus]|uniref:uncharacterized protein n=1 Tax=Miscanthus floridulus TaxID=154761 RepID=UPI00345A7314
MHCPDPTAASACRLNSMRLADVPSQGKPGLKGKELVVAKLSRFTTYLHSLLSPSLLPLFHLARGSGFRVRRQPTADSRQPTANISLLSTSSIIPSCSRFRLQSAARTSISYEEEEEPTVAAALLRGNCGGRASLPTRRPGSLLRAVAGASSGTGRLLRDELLHCSSASQAQRVPTPNVRCHPWQPPAPRVRGRCAARCSGTAYRKPCLFFCRKCCAACLCVPAGTYGNKNTCPCYNNWKTKRGGPKCP